MCSVQSTLDQDDYYGTPKAFKGYIHRDYIYEEAESSAKDLDMIIKTKSQV